MTHWTIAPVVLPAMMAAFMVLVLRHQPVLQRVFSFAGTVTLLVIAAALFWNASDGTVTLYQLGDWAAPFGIVLVADRLATLFVLLTALLAVLVLLYAIGSGWDMRGRHFHALYQFQLMGLMGAFLTGDAFNLFVFFEVLLIASYGLMIHGGGPERFRVGLQYVVFNLLGSTLFLFALGTIYGETGTLNMADLSQRIAEIPADRSAGIRVAAVLLIMVFAVKAALLPLHFWLPSAYSEAPAPVAALFAIMTKVGAYAIIRMYTLVFPPDLALTQGLFGAWLLPAALVSCAIGMIGVLGARGLDRLVAFSVVGSMGMLLTAVGLFTPAGISAALYYAIHSTLVTAALFLLVDIVRERRGARGSDLVAAPPFTGAALIAGLFFASAIAMAGLPPLSGFVGKLLILDAAFDDPRVWWVWAVILSSSLVAVVGFARAGSTIFWKSHAAAETERRDPELVPPLAPPVLPVIAIGGLIAALVALTVLAGPAQRFLSATSEQLFSPEAYVTEVMETPGKEITHGYEYDAELEAEAETDAGGHD
ncbi:monovalent cation/H+ antiporter subunit D [Histidinibacterium aquaticum]|uniref:Monovalent cation/H+ antiporter subunit D n=1 Tax=Histidinibacterium aquaticum TaxID=2613962 RepID=A0A5J5GR00_9RHOB|nr:monovalent cation/H+ antiporter subunit D [Histidinibacterium aquaticum]KAA9010183.1 monovalent cation/H+ antiporter subunit D [Histidinibacterium aquaticum]